MKKKLLSFAVLMLLGMAGISSQAVAQTINCAQRNGSFYLSTDTEGATIEYSYDNSSWQTFTRTITLFADATVYARISGTENVKTFTVTGAPTSVKTRTVYMGWGSFNAAKDAEGYHTLTGKDGDEAQGYAIKLMNSSKTYSALGSNKITMAEDKSKTCIKLSNGAENQIILPEGVVATRLTLYSMINKKEADASSIRTCYWKQVGGVDYDDKAIPEGVFNDTEDRSTNPDVRVYLLDNLTGAVSFTNTGEQVGFVLALDVIEPVEVSVGENGFASFSSAYALDFTNAQNVEAYVATSCAEGVVNMTKVDQVPAATGVVLKSVAGGATTENINVATSEVAAIATNYLKPMVEAGDIAASAEGAYNYVFGADNAGNVGFFKADAAYTSAAGKAYLQTTEDLTPTASTAAKGVMMVFGGETTGITQLNAAANAVKGTYYTLSGLRVAKPTKGLYILNGKKVVVK